MQKNAFSFVKGMGAGMIAGAAVIVVGKAMMDGKKNITKGTSKLLHAVGEFADGVRTVFK